MIAICAPVDLHGLARFSGERIEQIPPGLGSTATTPLIIELLRRNHDVAVYTLSPDLPEAQVYIWGKLRVVVGPWRGSGRARNFFRPEIGFLKRAIQADKPSFIHAHWTYEFALGALASGVPSLITIHDLPWNVLRYFRDPYRAVRLLMAYTVAAKGQKFTAVSEDAARHFRRYMHPGANIAVISNFIPQIVLAKSKGPQAHPQRPLIFATVLQGWSQQKNPKAALRAFQLLRRTVPEARLIMVGAGYEAIGAAADWAANHGFTEGVTFRGEMPYEEMLDYLQHNVDALLMPSVDESFSMIALEAMVLGKPIIGSSFIPVLRVNPGDEQIGLLTDVRRPDAICHAMLQLQHDPFLFEALANCAYARARKVFPAEIVIPQYERIYEAMSPGISAAARCQFLSER